MKHIFYCLTYILPVLCLYDTAEAQINTSPYEFTEIFRVGDEARGDTILFMDHLYTDMAVNSVNHLFIGGYRQSPVISFSDEGHFVGFVGAKGVGPGEFKGSRSVIVGPKDSVYVYDSSLRRLLVFKPGTLRYAYSMNIDDPPESSPFNLLGVTENGYLFKYRSPYRPPGDLLGGHDPDESRFDAVNLVDKQGAIAETSIARLPAKESVVRTYSNREGSGISVMSLPFGRASFFILNNSLLYSVINVNYFFGRRQLKFCKDRGRASRRSLEARSRVLFRPRPVRVNPIVDRRHTLSFPQTLSAWHSAHQYSWKHHVLPGFL